MSPLRLTIHALPTLRRWFWIGPPLGLMVLIFLLGTNAAGAGETRSLLARLLRFFAPGLYQGLSPETFHLLNIVFRKTGHFCGYALLGILNARAWLGLRGTFNRQGAGWSWSATVAWAAVDEFHQLFSSRRGGSARDVALDALGAAAGILLYSLWKQHTHRNR